MKVSVILLEAHLIRSALVEASYIRVHVHIHGMSYIHACMNVHVGRHDWFYYTSTKCAIPDDMCMYIYMTIHHLNSLTLLKVDKASALYWCIAPAVTHHFVGRRWSDEKRRVSSSVLMLSILDQGPTVRLQIAAKFLTRTKRKQDQHACLKRCIT
jgi:hypothetical protein